MNYKPNSIRTFLGSKNFKEAREFYRALGFEENPIDPKMSYFIIKNSLGFYLQDYYVKDWVENSMVFLEVEDLSKCFEEIRDKKLGKQFKEVRLSDVKTEDWGTEFHLIDPSGIFWRFAEFSKVV